MTLAEVGLIVAALPARMALMADLAFWCQMRRGEMFGLQRRHLDPLARVVHVDQSRGWVNGRVLTKGPKSVAGRRELSIPPHVLPVVERHLETFVGPVADAWVFTGERGRALGQATWNKEWAKARLTIGRPTLRLHDLRHAGLTLSAAQGATVAELMFRAGHASPAAAMRYQHATRDRDRVLADALSALVVAPVVEIGHVEGTAPGGPVP